jgi:3-hydroxyacyl-[acyl-carrier-protein] dehydratase
MTDVRFKQMVRPGATIELDVTLDEQLANAFYLTARVRCGDKLAVRFQFACTMAAAGGMTLDSGPSHV